MSSYYNVELVVESGMSATSYGVTREAVRAAQERAVRAVLEELQGKVEVASDIDGTFECLDPGHLKSIRKRWGIK